MVHLFRLSCQATWRFHFPKFSFAASSAVGSWLASLICIVTLAACGQSGGGGGNAGIGAGAAAPSTCVKPQDLVTAFQMAHVEAQVSRSGSLNLLVKIENPIDLENLQADLNLDQQAKFSKISSDILSISMEAESRASETIDRYINEKKIQYVEKDHETFSAETRDEHLAQAADQTVDLSSGQTLENTASSVNSEYSSSLAKQIIVAVIDTGVDYTHKDLAPYMWKNPKEVSGNGIDDDGNGFVDDIQGWDFANNDNDPMADDTPSYHGTHVAGIVKQAALLAENGIHIKIMPLKYLNSSAAGLTSVAVRAIDYAVQNGATVLNNSWGSFSYSSILAEAIERARAKKVLFIAASGNGDAMGHGVNIDQTPFYPAAYAINNVIAVAASDKSNRLAEWSNFGALNVDLSGPGVEIVSTRNGNTYGTLSGTSMAAPYISGVAALIWSQRPELTYTEVRKILSSTVQKSSSLSGKVLAGGAVSRTQAMAAAKEYVHNPNDQGVPEQAAPSGAACSN